MYLKFKLGYKVGPRLRELAARGSQEEAGLTQPRDYLFAHLCILMRKKMNHNQRESKELSCLLWEKVVADLLVGKLVLVESPGAA